MAKRIKIEPRRHSECERSKLIQYADDPVIAECNVNGERHVASTLVSCVFFKECKTKKETEHRKKRLGITDIYI